ncbi:glycosyltransferase family 4 protein [Terriglobus aquaticus]|uniref:Glycosyltransferase family 4 protein n=2 Tax=Terriglobus aquaticus TaxID=940139 RepID=A0ABW9KKZ9_9BACT
MKPTDSNPGGSSRPIRLAYVVSHPIQYQAPLLRELAADPSIDLCVFFCSDFSIRAYRDSGFGAEVRWDVPLTEGYRSVVLPRWRETTSPRTFAPIARGFLRHFARGLNGQRFDAVWVHGYSTVNSLHAILAARTLGIPVLLRAEPWLADRPRSAWRLALKRLFFTGLRSLISAVLPIGTRNAEYWSYYFGARFPAFLVPYAVDNDRFAAQIAQQYLAAPESLDLEPGRPVILFASKLQERKHCDDLLEAYLLLTADMPADQQPHLLIVGDGEQMPMLRARVAAVNAPLVRFAGFRNQTELPGIFALSTVFVLPSRHEPWGLIVNEAMACGLPVIVSDEVGCAVDLVQNGANGFIVPARDIAALAEALRSVLLPGVAQRRGECSRQRIAKWSFAEDRNGLKAALSFVTRLPVAAAQDGILPAVRNDHASRAL